jgi:hypothetical protein
VRAIAPRFRGVRSRVYFGLRKADELL